MDIPGLESRDKDIVISLAAESLINQLVYRISVSYSDPAGAPCNAGSPLPAASDRSFPQLQKCSSSADHTFF